MRLVRTRRLLPLLLALLAAGLVTGCTTPAETGRYSVTLITEQRHVLQGRHPVVGETIVAGGTVVLADGAEHRGSVTVLAGEALLSGRVVGDVTVLGGEAALTGTAEITGDVVDAGGEVTLAPAAVVRGRVSEGPGPATALQRTDDARSPAERALWSLLGTAVMAGLAWLVASLLPRPLHRTAAAATRFPVVSGALGALVLITALPLLVSMVFTLLLVPVAGIVLLGLGAAAVLGLLAIGRGLGVRLLRRAGRSWSTPRAAALGTAVLVAALQLLGLVPVVGAAVLLAAVVVSVGAVFLTGFGLRWYTPPDDAVDGPGTLEVLRSRDGPGPRARAEGGAAMVGQRRPSTRDVTPTQLGMLLGIVAGAAIGVTMFAITTDALWFVLPGVGVALGLGVGATIEKRRTPRPPRPSR